MCLDDIWKWKYEIQEWGHVYRKEEEEKANSHILWAGYPPGSFTYIFN